MSYQTNHHIFYHIRHQASHHVIRPASHRDSLRTSDPVSYVFPSAVFKHLTCPVVGCPHHSTGERSGINSRAALIQHIHSTHPSNFHLADLRICQEANLHPCPQCDCKVFCSKKKLQQHHRQHHNNTRFATTSELCLAHIVG